MLNNNSENDITKILHNKLKGVSVDAIEEKIGKALSELVGEDYKCSVSTVKYSLFSGAEIVMKVELGLNAEEKE